MRTFAGGGSNSGSDIISTALIHAVPHDHGMIAQCPCGKVSVDTRDNSSLTFAKWVANKDHSVSASGLKVAELFGTAGTGLVQSRLRKW